MSVPFSLHCTICLDAFDLHDRPPVVLPCGHTYLCQPCSKRLKVCMECRTPLYRTIPQKEAAQPLYHDQALSHDRSYSLHHLTLATSSSYSPIPARKVCMEPLPMPRNTVLMALIESSQVAEIRECDEEKGYQSGDDDEEVREGILKLKGGFGTFVVRERNGLMIHQSITSSSDDTNPDKENNAQNQVKKNDKLRVVLVPCTSADSSEEPTEAHLVEKSDSSLKPERLEFGQTVQIVSFEGNIAKIARGKGYLEATSNQLVKIGEAKDKACRIEGTLLFLEKRREELMHNLEDMERKIALLNDDLAEATAVPFDDHFAMAPSTDDDIFFGEDELNDNSPVTPGKLSLPERNLLSVPSMSSPSAQPRDRVHRESNSLTLPNLGSFMLGSDRISSFAPTVASSPSRPSGVDFRTGLSGHMALNSSKVTRHGYQREIRMMGEHRGISRIGPIRRVASQGGDGPGHSP